MLGVEVADGKVEHAPTEAKVVEGEVALAGDIGIGERGQSGDGIATAGGEVVVAAAVAGGGEDAREEVVIGCVPDVEGDGLFEAAGALVQVVFDRPGHRLLEGNRSGDRLDAFLGGSSGGLAAGEDFLLGGRLRGHGGAARQDQ